MFGVRFSLFTKIILWFFLNLLLIGIGLAIVFNFRVDPNTPYLGRASNRIEAVTRQIEIQTFDRTRAERDELLKKLSAEYNVDFFLFDNQGKQIGGRETALPAEIVKDITRPEGPPPLQRPPGETAPHPPGGSSVPPPPSVYFTTKEPTRYWFVGRIRLVDPDSGENVRSRVIVATDSYTGNGLFFDIKPFIVIATGIIGLSILLWFPFVRNITRDVRRMTNATTQIADEEFDVRVSQKRTDELGSLGTSINHLAGRLSGFVEGQKRFLGDISHELNSPLARMQFALGILEERVDEQNLDYVKDVMEEVELMSRLVAELLSYSRAGIRTPEIELEKVYLNPLVERVVQREAANAEVNIDDDLTVLAQPELLSRAISNVLRNAIRYAGDAGLITISAVRDGRDRVKIVIADQGPGVPDSALNKLFDPFYRIDSDRSRETGGTGLGMAIVKTCVETCKGHVSARNRTPTGLGITIILSTERVD